jgi:hypothetical protein
MFTLLKNITLTVLALAIGLAQPLAAAIDFNNVYETELIDEKELEVKEEAELFVNEEKNETNYLAHYELNNLQTQFKQKCAERSAIIAKLHHKFYILYDTWLV